MDTYEIIVAGGGPAGCFTAQQLAAKQIKVAIVEEHTTIGEPVHCAGLITPRVFELTRCPQSKIVQNKIYGAHIHSPDGSILTIGQGRKPHALVIDRQRFDQTLAQAAQKAGADILRNHKVISAKKQNQTIILSIQQDTQYSNTRCNLLIGADGARSHLRSTFGFPKPRELLYGIGAELSDTTLDPHFVHILVGHSIAPGFFAWVIPTNTHGTTARVGLCISTKSQHPLQHYFTTLLHHPLVQKATIMKRFGGAIPLGPLKKTVDDHVMLVGDAAAQVKPTSGGGIYPGVLCATHCADVASQALHRHRFDKQFLQHYHTRWTKELGWELSLGMRFRNVFTRLTDTQFNKYLHKLNTTKTIDVINDYGDIDYPSRLAVPLVKKVPSLLSFAPALFKRTKQ
jgi:digeranylgeranylglycerophospholipid reductase